MTRYLVGKKGFLKTTWDFSQAIEFANDGDIIELEEGFSPFYEQNNKPITITKSITIEGHLIQDEGNGRISANTIDGVIIEAGASVTLRNLEIRRNIDKCNNIIVRAGAALTAENIFLTSYASKGVNYPVIFIKGKSRVKLSNIELAPGNIHDRNYKIYAEDSELEIDSSLINAKIALANSRLDCQNSSVKYWESNALFAEKNSVVTAVHTTFEGGAEAGKDFWHCIKLLNSQFTAANITVNQPNSSNISTYADGSTLKIRNSLINSRINLTNSRLDCQNSAIKYWESNALFANKKNVITMTGTSIEGGIETEKRSIPCIKLLDSQFTASDMTVKQPNYNGAFQAKNTKVTLNSGRYDSLYFSGSEVAMGTVGIIESIGICDGSHVEAEEIDILGRDNGKVNLYVNKKSSLKAEVICFGKLSKPNVKVEYNTSLNVGQMSQLAYDLKAEQFVTDEEGFCKIIGDASEITYFGEKTALEQLNEMVGLRQAKQAVKEFIALAELNKRREAQGVQIPGFSLHCLFLGNPGTGKTTVARLIAKILYEKNVIKSDNFVEASRTELVGQYIGETAQKTRKVLESALNGVLFIDEAYTLWKQSDHKDFGAEAIDEILKFMEDHRTDIVLIFAGYTHSMEKFLESNEGLSSRIPNRIVFEDYTEDELIEIGLQSLHASKLKIDENAYADLVYKKYAESFDKSNGRWVRNLNEKLTRKMAVRIIETDAPDINLITQEDIDAI